MMPGEVAIRCGKSPDDHPGFDGTFDDDGVGDVVVGKLPIDLGLGCPKCGAKFTATVTVNGQSPKALGRRVVFSNGVALEEAQAGKTRH